MNRSYHQAQLAKRIKAKYPFVKIGNQYWTSKNFAETSTVLGTPIREMQPNANIEKVVNGEFNTDTGWSKGADWTISGGTINCAGTTNGSTFYQNGGLVTGKYYKVTYTISNYVSGGFRTWLGGYGAISSLVRSANGTYTEYIYKSTGSSVIEFGSNGLFIGSIDNISVQEIGWSGSQELYDGIYSQTAGTAEQKTYAAVKAAGFWCNYNNDPALGLIYGKLYNWFAVKLIQMDIDYYNAQLLATYGNTPEYYTRRYEWRIPTQTDFTALMSYCNGLPGKVKKQGTANWNSPNANADNSTGLGMIGSGSQENGFKYLLARAHYHSITEIGNNTYRLDVTANDAGFGNGTGNNKVHGCSIRQIKAA